MNWIGRNITLPEIFSNTNRVSVTFKTDSSVQFSGWMLEWRELPECIVLDTETGEWRNGEMDPHPKNPRIHSSVVVLSSGVFLIGGAYSPDTSNFLATTTAATNPTTLTYTATNEGRKKRGVT